MKSTTVYSLLRQELALGLSTLGFKREKQLLSWSRKAGGLYTVLWFQVSRDGWDEFAGSAFTIEFQKSSEPTPGALSSISRKRFQGLLTAPQLEQIKTIQNSIISELKSPPSSHPALNISPEGSRCYKEKFLIDSIPYKNTDDLWLRYASPEHLHLWGAFLSEALPQFINIFENLNVSHNA